MRTRNAVSEDVKKQAAFSAKNYRNSPLIREFYRFIAKNGLRSESFKLLESESIKLKKKSEYLQNLSM